MKRRTFLAFAMTGTAARTQQNDPMYLLTYDHGGLVLWGIPHFKERLHEAIAWLDRYPGFKIGLDNEAYTYDYLAERDPSLLDELRGLVAKYKGRFGLGTCTYGQPLSTFICGESNIRQLQYARDTNLRHFGTTPRTYLMSEHAMHAQIPQLLRGFGFDRAILRTHYMMYGYNPTFDAPVGWWTGPDGTRIAAVPTYKGEGAEFGRTTTDNWILTRCPGRDCRGSLEQFRADHANMTPLLATRADDSGLRREDLVKETESKRGYRWVLLEDLPSVLPEPTAVFATGPNDFTVRMPWGYCGNEIWNRCREAEVAVLSAERAAALELISGGSNRQAELDRAWKNILVAQHHDVQICGLLPDSRRFLKASQEASAQVLESSLTAVAGRMQGGTFGQITVLNPRSWAASDWVDVEIDLPRAAGKTIRAVRNGQPVPTVLLSTLRGSDDRLQHARIAVLASPPPLGIASYAIEAGEPPAVDAAPSYWRIELGSNGGIDAVVDRKSGRTMFRDAGFVGTINGERCVSSGHWTEVPTVPGARWRAWREDGQIGGIPYRLHLTSWADSPRIDMRVRFEFAAQKIGLLSENKRDARSPFVHEEKLRYRFFPNTGSGAMGVRDLPFIVAETSARYVEGNYWTALAGSDGGVAVFNRGTMGSVREEGGAFSVPLAYSMYYIWGTRILDGEYTYEFALLPFEGAWQRADPHRLALDYALPMRALANESGDGRLGAEFAPVRASGEGVIASALFPRGGSVYARWYEYQGREARLQFTTEVEETELGGRVMEKATGDIRFRPWQIRTFRLHR